ncbi:MAG: hypothetical protein HDQ88_02335 [Clostridia bacterium]|nr:hypothetical protein [Clostridia bacterium]
MATKSSLKRVSITVPRNDAKCNDWLEKQSNVSMSLRFLIYDAIARWGMSDITMEVLPQAMLNAGNRRGRSKAQAEPVAKPAAEPVKQDVKQKTHDIPAQPVPVKSVVAAPPPPPVVEEDEEGFIDPMAFLNLGQ